MAFVVRYRTEARAEIENAFLWFEEQQRGLGSAFIAQLEILDARIAEYPYLPQTREQLLARA